MGAGSWEEQLSSFLSLELELLPAYGDVGWTKEVT